MLFASFWRRWDTHASYVRTLHLLFILCVSACACMIYRKEWKFEVQAVGKSGKVTNHSLQVIIEAPSATASVSAPLVSPSISTTASSGNNNATINSSTNQPSPSLLSAPREMILPLSPSPSPPQSPRRVLEKEEGDRPSVSFSPLPPQKSLLHEALHAAGASSEEGATVSNEITKTDHSEDENGKKDDSNKTDETDGHDSNTDNKRNVAADQPSTTSPAVSSTSTAAPRGDRLSSPLIGRSYAPSSPRALARLSSPPSTGSLSPPSPSPSSLQSSGTPPKTLSSSQPVQASYSSPASALSSTSPPSVATSPPSQRCMSPARQHHASPQYGGKLVFYDVSIKKQQSTEIDASQILQGVFSSFVSYSVCRGGHSQASAFVCLRSTNSYTCNPPLSTVNKSRKEKRLELLMDGQNKVFLEKLVYWLRLQ